MTFEGCNSLECGAANVAKHIPQLQNARKIEKALKTRTAHWDIYPLALSQVQLEQKGVYWSWYWMKLWWRKQESQWGPSSRVLWRMTGTEIGKGMENRNSYHIVVIRYSQSPIFTQPPVPYQPPWLCKLWQPPPPQPVLQSQVLYLWHWMRQWLQDCHSVAIHVPEKLNQRWKIAQLAMILRMVDGSLIFPRGQLHVYWCDKVRVKIGTKDRPHTVPLPLYPHFIVINFITYIFASFIIVIVAIVAIGNGPSTQYHLPHTHHPHTCFHSSPNWLHAL